MKNYEYIDLSGDDDYDEIAQLVAPEDADLDDVESDARKTYGWGDEITVDWESQRDERVHTGSNPANVGAASEATGSDWIGIVK